MSIKVSLKYKKHPAELVKAVFKKAMDKETLDQIGTEMVRMNQSLVRQGKLPEGKLNSLSERWIRRRKVLSQWNETGIGYSHRKSNLTFTGQLLKAIYFISKPFMGRIDIDVHETKRKKYVMASGKKSKAANLTNKQLAEYLAEKGTVFVGLTQQMRDRANKILERKFRQLLRSLK